MMNALSMPKLEEKLMSETLKVCHALLLSEKADSSDGLEFHLTAAMWHILEVSRFAGFPPEEMSEGSFLMHIPSSFDRLEALAEAKIAASDAVGILGKIAAIGGDINDLELHVMSIIRQVCWCMRAEGMNIRLKMDEHTQYMKG